MEYHFREIEKKWQEIWKEKKPFKAENNSAKPKYYVLDMFPYPSGAGLHVGHPLGYIASDIMARYKRHKGFNVLHPMGWDSFGLPAEQYAIQTGQHPKITTEQNIARYKDQMNKIGFSFDWDREIKTSDPEYYKWTQWVFIQIFNSWYNNANGRAQKIETLIAEFEKNGNEKINAACDEDTKHFTAAQWKSFSEKEKSDTLMQYRLAYLGDAYVNWCAALGTVLANDEVKDGVSERGGHPVERKLMKQWSMRITAYAQRLLDDLNTIDWTESLKESQRYWIGRSEGTSLKFKIHGLSQDLSPTLSKGKGVHSGTEEFFDSERDIPGYYTTDVALFKALHGRAVEMRDNPTPAEDLLWKSLKGNKLNVHFRRQQIIGNFIVDFVCLSRNLVVEVDGDIHDHQKEEDEKRTKYLIKSGFKVIRFRNEKVVENINAVLKEIESVLETQSKVLPLGEDLGEVLEIEVFTTRPDTIFGVSFVTLAPEHELVNKITTKEQKAAVDDYVTKTKNRSERERQADVNKVSGVFTGAYAEHPFTGKLIPIWIGDYVLAGYGTGAVMAVPAHDERDFKFATHFGLEKPQVITPTAEHDFATASWDEKEGKLINSDFLNGLDVKTAIKKAIEKISQGNLGTGKINFRLRDAVFGRQRYWGEPIPVFYKDGIPYACEEKHLPIELPDVDKYLPTEDGEPPLARATNWSYSPLLGRGGGGEVYPLETTTMPGWAGSSWYFLRYMDAHNSGQLVSRQLADYWGQVDLYIGGSEHATGHLLYVRFWTKFLNDLNFISVDEPAKKLINQGMIQGISAMARVANISFNAKETEEKVTIDDIQALLIDRRFSENLPFQDIEIHIPIDFVTFREGKNVITKEDLEILKIAHPRFTNARFLTNEDCKIFNVPFKDELGSDFIELKDVVEKMSKSKYNVVSPDDICEKFGVDTLRLYEMFLGPLEQSKPWNTNGITGVSGFLKKLWKLAMGVLEAEKNSPLLGRGAGGEVTKAELKTLHKTIKKITEDIERFSFNTSVSNFMICVNELTEQKCNKRAILEPLLVLVSPYAPHIAEELWEQLGHKEGIALEPFPEFNEAHLVEDNFNYPISFNGKMRFNIEMSLTLSVPEIEKLVMENEQTQKFLEGKAPKKVIVVPKKIVNIVV
ncbi:MAG TPA: class I tRNA ligase family protein [Bacteroidia bacterium]|jgi:leucyl-tRNA synthetase|nr:class I tRNA ligase family protein [Bacteroidia bacterium]